MKKNALIIIAKYPETDSVKTRLKGSLPDEQRIAIYVSMLEDTVRKFRAVPHTDTFIAFAPEHAVEYFKRFGIGLISLMEGDLGERMHQAFSELFTKGYHYVCLVGTDIPDLSEQTVLNSFELLLSNDIVFGPALDGGYYLVAMKKLITEVFDQVPWSSNITLKKSIEQAARHGYSVGFTKTLSDIDTVEDLKKAGLL